MSLWGRDPSRVSLTRLRAADLISEAFDSVTARPGRAVLTMLGTVLGTSAFVATLGLTTTASDQISATFTAEIATQVTVFSSQAPIARSSEPSFPDGAAERLRALHGVRGIGVSWATGPGGGQTAADVTTLPPSVRAGVPAAQFAITAATPDYLAAIGTKISEGRIYGQFQQDAGLPICVLGAAVARALGVTDLNGDPAVFINGIPISVIGIIKSSSYQQESTLENIFVPTSLAIRLWGDPQPNVNPGSMFIVTTIGAASQVGAEVPYAISPQDPTLYHVTVPPNPDQGISVNINHSLTGLFYALAVISLLIGAAGITNTTLVTVLERTKEIGLRRAFGARRSHIVAHFMTEAATLGLLGGVAGGALGAWMVVVVAISQRWTPVISPLTLLPAPLVGAAIGLLAGLYPALRASRIEPVEALRTSLRRPAGRWPEP
jgi:putative ABC transport system permease protein